MVLASLAQQQLVEALVEVLAVVVLGGLLRLLGPMGRQSATGR